MMRISIEVVYININLKYSTDQLCEFMTKRNEHTSRANHIANETTKEITIKMALNK